MEAAEQLIEAGATILHDADGTSERRWASLVEVGEQTIERPHGGGGRGEVAGRH